MCYSALKWKDVLTQDTAWLDLEDVGLSEIRQTQKDRQTPVRSQMGPTQRREAQVGEGSQHSVGTECQLGGMEALQVDGGDGPSTCDCTGAKE